MSPLSPFDGMRRGLVDALSREDRRERVEDTPPLRAARARFVAGPGVSDALDIADELSRTGRRAAIQPLAGSEDDQETRLGRCREAVLAATEGVGVVVAPADLGVESGSRPSDVERALEDLVALARQRGTGITVRTAQPEHDDLVLDAGIRVATRLGGVVADPEPPLRISVMARRHRAERDCARLCDLGIPVRLVRGGPRGGGSTAWLDRHEADLAYVRCLSTLLATGPRPMVATQDPALLEVTDALAEHHGREHDVEYQMYLGAQPDRQVRTADAGHHVRVLVPYGPGWFGYLADLAERPATALRLVQVLTGRG